MTAMLNFGSSSGHRLVAPLADREQLVERHAALGGERREVLLHQRAWEAVDPGRHRRVGREHAAAADGLDGGVERQPAGDQLADPLEAEERRRGPRSMWKTSGARPSARSARTPPMPSTISWRSRWCSSPP